MPSQYLTGTAFPDWDTSTVQAATGQQVDLVGKQALIFYKGDHWQMGMAWGGPVPDQATTKPDDAKRFMDKIMQLFTSANIIAEVSERHVDSVFGKVPSWNFLPLAAKAGDDEQADADPLVAEIEAALVNWLDKRKAHQYLLQAAYEYAVCGVGMVRLFIPPGLLAEGVNGGKAIPAGLSLEEALDLVYIEHIDPSRAGAGWDRNTMSEAAFMHWDESVQIQTGTQTRMRTELQYTERSAGGKKKLTTVKTWTLTQLDGTIQLDLGGELLMRQMFNPHPLVTQQVMQMQKAANFALTAMGNNNANAGFLERIITNAQPPGQYVKKEGSQKEEFIPTAYKAGAGSTTWLQGHPISNDEGVTTGFTEPKVVFRDPSSPEAYKASLDEYRQGIYLEVKQGHVLAQGDGGISGASRIQMRADFEASLRDTKVEAEATYRWILGVLAKLGAIFSGSPGKYDTLRVATKAAIDTGPLTDAERTAILEQYKEGVRSRESTMELLGIEDPDAEWQRILGEQPDDKVTLDTLALFGLELEPEAVIALYVRAGLPAPSLESLKAQKAAKDQMAQSAADARNRSLNPADPAVDPGAAV